MDTFLLIKNIKDTDTIIDFITVVYGFLSGSDLTSLRGKYKKAFYNDSIREIFNSIDIAFEVIFYEDNSANPTLSNSFKNDWISIIRINIDIIDLLCFETLNVFDKYYLDNVDEDLHYKQIILKQGPLNLKLSHHFKFFNKPPKRYNSKKLEENRIRIGRQTIIADTNSLSNEFKKFEIIPSNQMFGYDTTITKYKLNIDTSNIVLGIVPADVNSFINVKYLSSKKLINIDYKNEYEKDYLKKLKSTLNNMEKDGITIAVFPELFLFPDTISKIAKYCIENQFDSLKLIFIGSAWSNNQNISYILSSKGTRILSHTKKMPYDHYINSEQYIENIIHDNKINIVDIDGLGRIGYLICKDVLSDNLNHLYTSIFSTNLVFVSAFTSQTSLMFHKASADAETKAVSTIMCNSYSSVEFNKNDSNNLLCYICKPDIKEKSLNLSVDFRNKGGEWPAELNGFYNYFRIPLE